MSTYFCRECGYETPKWAGKCPVCQSWDSFKEAESVTGKKEVRQDSSLRTENSESELLLEVQLSTENRINTGVSEFDTVLGGGITPGMVCLIGGEPGIGKSTLMLQIADKTAEKDKKVLYVTGEESQKQIKFRSDRLGIRNPNLYLFCSNSAEQIIEVIRKDEPQMVVIDSIQSIGTSESSGIPGSVAQVREAAMLFTHYAKRQGIPFFIIGHITKEGMVAGPKMIEHLVDTVLYFEGDGNNQLKILRSSKNRFGSTNEIGVFEMREQGLAEVLNPSRLFVQEGELSAGAAIGCVLEGSRSFLLEVQALVTPAIYGNAQRIALGIDHRKLALLLAIIEKNLFLKVREKDIFVNMVGGLKINDPALDLPLVAAIISSFEEKQLPVKTVFIGEIGLNGEIRSVSQIEKRIAEAVKLGYQRIVIPSRAKFENRRKANIILIEHLTEIYPVLFSEKKQSE
jgi:DNA repair protein RadA/Sms